MVANRDGESRSRGKRSERRGRLERSEIGASTSARLRPPELSDTLDTNSRYGPNMSITALAVLAGLVPAVPSPVGPGPPTPPCEAPEHHQFDFWFGDWDVLNVWKQRDASEFQEVGRATNRVHAVAGGCGVVEHWQGWLGPNLIVGFSVRSWNPVTGEWDLVLLWPQPDRTSFSTLHGAFRHGRGEFFGGGPEQITRYTFSDVRDSTFLWSDAYSTDGGVTWSHSWIMEFSRRGPTADPLVLNAAATRDFRCGAERYRALDPAAGEWHGTAAGDAGGGPARLQLVPILGGCAVMGFLHVERAGGELLSLFSVWARDDAAGEWVEWRMSSDRPVLRRLASPTAGEGAMFGGSYEGVEGPLRLRTVWRTVGDDALELVFEESADEGASWREARRLELRRVL